jgi:hypothetical protein
MYEVIAKEMVEIGSKRRFLGTTNFCRFCGTTDPSMFGRRTNAHTFPEALGNKILFSLEECVVCNNKFSIYEDALCKAIGPFLTLGGVRGKNGVRQTGRSGSDFVIRYDNLGGRRNVKIQAKVPEVNMAFSQPRSDVIKIRIPVNGDMYVPLYAYKALLKIAISLLPVDELNLFKKAKESLQIENKPPAIGELRVGFSYAYIGNAPPTLAGVLIRRRKSDASIPYILAVFQAGSVCFQIALCSDDKDDHVPITNELGIVWTSQLPKPDGGYHQIKYSNPLQFDWSGLTNQIQPFQAFDLEFNVVTNAGVFSPVVRE